MMIKFETLDTFYAEFPITALLTKRLIERAPEQEKFIARRFSELEDREARNIENFSAMVTRLCGNYIDQHIDDYLFQCEEQKREEMYFLRHGSYRLKTFADAVEEVYSDSEYMKRYMNGQLMSQIWWSNHTRMLSFFVEEFLGGGGHDRTHLEIGPGHGLLLYLAMTGGQLSQVEAWDVSAASIELTSKCLSDLGAPEMPELRVNDMFDAPKNRFSSIVFSEVLEHLEQPREALDVLYDLLDDSGHLFLNVPVNAPAPDHIFNWSSPAELQAFIEDAGFEIERVQFFPATNYNLDRAIKMKLTVSCGFIARKASRA